MKFFVFIIVCVANFMEIIHRKWWKLFYSKVYCSFQHTFSIVCLVESVHICICYSHCLLHANKRLVKMLKEINRIQNVWNFYQYHPSMLTLIRCLEWDLEKVDVVAVIHSLTVLILFSNKEWNNTESFIIDVT